MKARLETFAKKRGIRLGACVDGTCLFVLEVAEGRHILSISKDKNSQPESPSDPAITIESLSATNSLGPVAVLDPHEKNVFASLADRRRVYVLSIPKQSCRVTTNQALHDLGFEGKLFGLKPFRNRLMSYSNDCFGIIAAISASGEVALLCASGNRLEVKQRTVEVPSVDRVLHVTTFEDDHLVVVALRDSKLLFYAIHINQGESLESLKLHVLPEVFLPEAPREAPTLQARDGIIGFAVQRECAIVLYSGGYAHILSPNQSSLPSTNVSFSSCWSWSRSSDSGPPKASSAILRHAMRLSQGRTVDSELASPKDWRRFPTESDGVVSLGSGLFAIAYGEYISIWDGTYCTGHSYVQAPANIDFLFRDSSSGHAFAVSKDTVLRLRVGEKHGSVSLTLGAAIKHKGACDPIVISVQDNVERAPLRCQPVTVGLVQAAAESGGQIDRIFRRLMETEEENEVKQIRSLLGRDSIPSAEALIGTTHTYFKHKRKIRRGDYGSQSDLGLAKLPSERLGAVAVARCVYEIGCGNSNFVVPFIDMLGTGVVSSEAVVSVLGVSDSWDMGPGAKSLDISSICDPLIASDAYLNALEAVLSRVADLPERDIVRVFRFSVQLIINAGSADGPETLKRWQCKRLLRRCMTHRVQQNRLVHIIKKLPFSDVITCIGVLEEFLSGEDEPPPEGKPKIPRHVRTGQFVKKGITEGEAFLYRGLGNWVDKDYEQQLACREIDETEACVKWVSSLIDAHLAALIIDENGQQIASRVLDIIRTRRKESEALKGISGLVSHLIERNAVPGHEDPLYKVTHHEVPLPMALE